LLLIQSGKSEDSPPEVVEISGSLFRKEVIATLVELGIIFPDTVPSDVRSDMAFLRAFRLGVESGRKEAFSVLIKGLVTVALGLLALGILRWTKGEVSL
jgi:hypothetical protein